MILPVFYLKLIKSFYFQFIQQENCQLKGSALKSLLNKITHDNKLLVNQDAMVLECISNESKKVIVTIGAGDIDLLVPKIKNHLTVYD